MLVLFVMNWHLPELIRHPISLLGSLCSPLSLVLVGAKLAAVRPRELFAGRALKAAALIRLVGIPLATIAVLCVLRPPREVAMVPGYYERHGLWRPIRWRRPSRPASLPIFVQNLPRLQTCCFPLRCRQFCCWHRPSLHGKTNGAALF